MMLDKIKERLPQTLQTPGEIEPNWAYFVALHGEEGLRWVEELCRPEHMEMMAGMNESLRLLRTRQIERGREVLENVKGSLDTLAPTAPGVDHALGRWYYGALAYYHYCQEDFESADQALDEAHNEVCRTLERRPFLLPFATHCHDFGVQRIRIVRNRRRWPEMWRHVAIAREMVTGERPFCTLGDGTPVDLVAIQAFYRSIPGLTPEEQGPLRSLFDDSFRLRLFEVVLAKIFAMPGFVIPYLPGNQAGA